MKASRLIDDPKLMTASVVGAAVLGAGVWAASFLRPAQDEGRLGPKSKLDMPAGGRVQDSPAPSEAADDGRLAVKRISSERLSASVVTADDLAPADDRRDASAEEVSGTMDEVRDMQMAAGQTADLGAGTADTAALLEEARKKKREMGSLGKIDKFGNTDFVAAGAAAMAAAEAEHEGPISKERAQEIKTAGLVAKKPSSGGPVRRFVRGEAAPARGEAAASGRTLRGAVSGRPPVSAFAGAAGSSGSAADVPGGVSGAGPRLALAGGAGLGGAASASRAAAVGGAGGGLAGGTAGMGGGGGGVGSGNNVASQKASEPVTKKSWRAIEGQALDYLGVADSYFKDVVSQVFDHERRMVPLLRANVQKADLELAALAKTVATAKSRYRGYPRALSAVEDVEAVINVEQRPRLAGAAAGMTEGLKRIDRVPGKCLRYFTHWDTVYYEGDGNNGGDDDGGYFHRQKELLAKQGWTYDGSRFSKQVERREPVDPRAEALAAQKELTAALEAARHVHQISDIAAKTAEGEIHEIAAGMTPASEGQAFASFGRTVAAQMRRVMALIPPTLMVGEFNADLGALKDGALSGRMKIQAMNKRAKNENLAYPQTADLSAFQDLMTSAVENSSEALGHSTAADQSLFSLIKTGEGSTGAYVDVCDAKLRLEALTKAAK